MKNGVRLAACGVRLATCGWRLAAGGWRRAVWGKGSKLNIQGKDLALSLIHISEPTRPY